MQIRSMRLPRSRYLERGAAELSREAQQRLSASWRIRLLPRARPEGGLDLPLLWDQPTDVLSLEAALRSPEPAHAGGGLAPASPPAPSVRQLADWGKDKLAVLLRRQGWKVSVSMVGRILASLRQRGVLSAPMLFRVKRRRGTARRPWALRKPSDYAVEQPGDLVQLDTMDLRPSPGVVLKQFTARDVVSRWDVIEVHRRATSTAAALFLQTLQSAVFEQACRQRGVRLFVLPPRSPKLNGRVERANRTHTEEFYEITPCSLPISQLNQELLDWERTYNTVRPHQALGYLTPHQFLALSSSQRKDLQCH